MLCDVTKEPFDQSNAAAWLDEQDCCLRRLFGLKGMNLVEGKGGKVLLAP